MPTTTLEDLKDHLQGLLRFTEAYESVQALVDLEVVTPFEALVMHTRLRAKIREAVDSIPRDEG